MTTTNKCLGLILGSAVLLAAGTRAADVGTFSSSLDGRIADSLQAYKDQSKRIADEKIPLLREINQLENENIGLRDQIARSLSATAENNKTFDALRNRLEGLKAQTEYAQRFLQEYLDSFESRIQVSEDQHYKDQLTEIRKSLEQPSADLSERFEKQLAAIDLGLERAETIIGGYTFEGKGIAPGGVLKDGRVVVVGPSAYFRDTSDGGGVNGILQFHTGTIEPGIVAVGSPYSQQIEAYADKGSGTLPLDPSLGSAVAVQATNVRLVDHVKSGGPVGYVILALGAIALVLAVIKLFDIGRFRSVDSRKIATIIREARGPSPEKALAEVAAIRGPVGEMLELGIRNIGANSVLLEELMLSVILRRRPEIERYLPFLAITAASAPLLGLLGTVVGMIRTFALITIFGTGDPHALSGGISVALVTTELGLMVAIPTLILHGVFTRMIKSRFGDMERLAFEFVKTIALEESKAESK